MGGLHGLSIEPADETSGVTLTLEMRRDAVTDSFGCGVTDMENYVQNVGLEGNAARCGLLPMDQIVSLDGMPLTQPIASLLEGKLQVTLEVVRLPHEEHPAIQAKFEANSSYTVLWPHASTHCTISHAQDGG